MADKRMFTKKIIDSDAFLDMPLSSQALYFHICMNADDDGFVNNPRRIARLIGASEDDLKLLVMKRFLLAFPSGVVVVKHWRMHNTLKSDRYHPTDYREELNSLYVKKNKAYTDNPAADECEIPQLPPSGNSSEPSRNTSGTELEPEISIDLGIDVDIEESSIDLGIDNNNTTSIVDTSNTTDTTASGEAVCRPKIVRRADVARVVNAWNNLGLTQVTKVTSNTKRGQMLKARIVEYGVDKVIDAINNIACSAFLKGQNDSGWTITFDWFVKPNNFLKVLEGNYAKTSNASPSTSASGNQFINLITGGKLNE